MIKMVLKLLEHGFQCVQYKDVGRKKKESRKQWRAMVVRQEAQSQDLHPEQ